MPDEEKTRVDKFLNLIRNNKITSTIIILCLTIIGAATVKEKICTLFPNFSIVCTTNINTNTSPSPTPEICQVEKDFKVNINFRDSQLAKKNSIKEALETTGYYNDSHNTDFAELDSPGEKGTAWLKYPQCIKETDERMQKVIKILNANGYKTGENLQVSPFSSQGNKKLVQISLF
jgi:hypothetical protein